MRGGDDDSKFMKRIKEKKAERKGLIKTCQMFLAKNFAMKSLG